MTGTTTDRFNTSPEEGVKAPCRMATTANITLSGLQTINAVVGAANDRVLVKDQTTATENGIYLMQSTAWTRSPDWNDSSDVTGSGILVVVSGGTNAGIWRAVYTGSYAVGSTSVTFEQSAFYAHPNHTGQVTSVADGATVLDPTAITAQTAITTGLAATDELLLSDAGVLKKMALSVLETYLDTAASETAAGIAEIATQVEVNTATDDVRFVTPLKAKAGTLNLFSATGSAPVFACRAFAVWDGSAAGTILNSGNVSSITDDGVGLATVTFSVAMSSANYAFAGSAVRSVEATVTAQATPTASSIQVRTSGGGGGAGDFDRTSIIVFE